MAQDFITLEELEGNAPPPTRNNMSGSVMSPDYVPPSQSALPELGGLIGGLLSATPYGRFVGAGGRGVEFIASRFPALRSFLPSLFGSSVGTAIGTGAEQAITKEVVPSRFAANLAENAIWDVSGNLVFKLGGDTVRLTKDVLQRLNLNKNEIPDASLAAQRFLAQSGEPRATLTKAQLLQTPGQIAAERLARGGTGSTLFEAQEQAVRKAVESGKKNFFDKLDVDPEFTATLGTGASVDFAAGSAFKGAIDKGYLALQAEVDPFYKALSTRGKNVTVDFSPIKKAAEKELAAAASMSETGKAASALTEEVANELRMISDLKGSITFDQAHQYRSTLLSRIRELESQEVRPTNLLRILKATANQLETKMDDAAKALDPALKQEYDKVSGFYKEAISDLYPQTIIKALRQNPERVGESLFRTGNETEVRDTIKAARRIETLTAKTDNPIKSNEVLNSMRYGYLNGMLSTFESTVKFANDLDNAKFARTFTALFPDKAQQDVLRGMANAAKLSQVGKETFGVQSRTVGSVVQVATLAGGGTAAFLALTPDQQDKLAENVPASVISAGVILLTPRLLAKAMTDPGAVNALAKVVGTQKVDPRVYGAALTKLSAYWNNAGLFDNDYISAVQEAVGTRVPEGQRGSQPIIPPSPEDFIRLEDLE
jgi:hypothetical protein